MLTSRSVSIVTTGLVSEATLKMVSYGAGTPAASSPNTFTSRSRPSRMTATPSAGTLFSFSTASIVCASA
jgi:hypothetical protein